MSHHRCISSELRSHFWQHCHLFHRRRNIFSKKIWTHRLKSRRNSTTNIKKTSIKLRVAWTWRRRMQPNQSSHGEILVNIFRNSIATNPNWQALKSWYKKKTICSRVVFFVPEKSRHGLLRVVIFSLLNRLTAHSIFLNYGSAIIPHVGSNVSPELASIFMSAVQLASTFVTYKLISCKGRKFILMLSLVGCATGHALMIAYVQLNDGHSFQSSTAFHLIPLICMSIVIFVASIGVVPLTFICIAESFPTKSRPFGMVFGNIAFNSFAFVINKMYPLVEARIGLKACLIVFCVACTFGITYVGFLINDTCEEKPATDDDADESDETDEFDDADETILRLQMRREMRRMSRSYRLSQYRIQPRHVRKYSVVTFA